MTDERRLTVLLAEDQVLLRSGIARLLQDAGMEVVAEAGDADDAIRKVRAHRPDVAIFDIQMPPGNTDDGLRAAIAMRSELPDMGVLVLSQFLEESYALELIADDAEGVGYLLKDRVMDIDGFVESIRRVAAGGSVLDPEVVARMVGRRRRDDPLADLTPREREVLGLMAEGKSNRGIADSLGVSPAAVEKHSTSIFHKLGLGAEPNEHRRVMAVLKTLER
jgi:DNA-binding NarL/FixJ family response regulator